MVKHIDTMSVKELRQALKQARKDYMPPVSKMKRGSLISEYVRMKQPGETLKAEEILFEKEQSKQKIRRAVPGMPKVIGASEVSRPIAQMRVREGAGDRSLIARKEAPERFADVQTMEGMELVQMGKKKKMKEMKKTVEMQTEEPVATSSSTVKAKTTAKKSGMKQVDEPVASAMRAVAEEKQPSIKKYMTPKMEAPKQIRSVDAPVGLLVEPYSSSSEYGKGKSAPMKKVSLTASVEGKAPEPNLTVLRRAVVDDTGNVVIGEPEAPKKRGRKPKGEKVAKVVEKIEEVVVKGKRPASEYNNFVASGRRQGKTMAEIAFEWKNRPM